MKNNFFEGVYSAIFSVYDENMNVKKEVKEEVRTVKTQIVHSAETLNALADICRQLGKNLPAKAVMGVICGHKNHLVARILSILHQNKTNI